MSDIIPVSPGPPVPLPSSVALESTAPSIERLFLFARDAELRVRSLRMHIEERSWNARGEDATRHEVLVRHPGHARVTSRRSEEPLSRDYTVWAADPDTVRTYRARDGLASVRPRRSGVAGSGRPDLPAFARTRPVLTALPAGSLADTFVHPHGLFRNVLVTGPLEVVGAATVEGRDAIVVRAWHPRSTDVLTDRPDRFVDVGIDRATGFLSLLVEHVAERVTQHARVTLLEVDPEIPDEALRLHLGADVRMLY